MKMQLGIGLFEIFMFLAPHLHSYEGLALMSSPVSPGKSVHSTPTNKGVTSTHPHVCVYLHAPTVSHDPLPLQSHHKRLMLTPAEVREK